MLIETFLKYFYGTFLSVEQFLKNCKKYFIALSVVYNFFRFFQHSFMLCTTLAKCNSNSTQLKFLAIFLLSVAAASAATVVVVAVADWGLPFEN